MVGEGSCNISSGQSGCVRLKSSGDGQGVLSFEEWVGLGWGLLGTKGPENSIYSEKRCD